MKTGADTFMYVHVEACERQMFFGDILMPLRVTIFLYFLFSANKCTQSRGSQPD